MTKTILAFGASNSKASINHQLALRVGDLVAAELGDARVTSLLLHDFDMPVYSIDRENADGIPAPAQAFIDALAAADGVVISFAEHNGSLTAAFKNVFDWASRIDGKVYQGKPLLALATSPGARGGQSVLDHAAAQAPFRGAASVEVFSLPSFGETFADGAVLDGEHAKRLAQAVAAFAERV
ncbi:NADPH-dependent FMN reductase [Rhodobacteraceae bacterium THAF1]|uniref:NADPH-dependent FMN reductase n=1 Tax=Palleronia sp. THAF1 TaxID=2587842 RepID=UPI000F3E0FA6|nr:NAD(P)H-dependent oxidoreductase [Palleronia sp. THAF1]QFU07576.1 NADPH-dependent FMN reductase [Palleronia sp. THAF1]VDC22861.1 NADPH-dependent FMN reductase [Rhodobacteraceae bacterium THAF1]